MYPGTQTAGQSLRGNGGTAIGSLPAGAIERVTVQSALDEQERIISGVHDTISQLEQRLQAVLGPVGPSGDLATKAPVLPSTIMQRVESHNRTILGAGQRLIELINRLEI